MGSSYRDDLRNGYMTDWEKKIRQAHDLLGEVAEEVSECIGSDGQYDNAADDGALQQILWDTREALRGLVPMTPEEKANRIDILERQLASLKKG